VIFEDTFTHLFDLDEKKELSCIKQVEPLEVSSIKSTLIPQEGTIYPLPFVVAVPGGNVDGIDCDSTADGDEQIYWLRPKLRPSPVQSPSDTSGAPTSDKGWLNKKLKHKVTFNDLPSTSGSR
jgi:hypothetical protein